MIARASHLLLLVAMLPAFAQAADNKPPVAPYVLKNRSSFTAVGEDQRAPFWPIGWAKRKPVAVAAAAPVQQVAAPVRVSFDTTGVKVTSILIGSPSLAIINGRSYSEGDFLRMPKGTTPAPRVRVYRINDGNVILEHQTERFMVALQRPELVQRSNVEDLLTEDRP